MAENSDASAGTLKTNDLLLAILTLLVDGREQMAVDRPQQAKTEILLSNAGLPYGTIAALLGKKPDAVRMMITRAKAAGDGGRAKRKTTTVESGIRGKSDA